MSAETPYDHSSPLAKGYECVVGIDFGTSGIGVCVANVIDSSLTDTPIMQRLVHLQVSDLVADTAITANTEKQTTALALAPITKRCQAFGKDAMKYMIKAAERDEAVEFYNSFKMELRPPTGSLVKRSEPIEGILVAAKMETNLTLKDPQRGRVSLLHLIATSLAKVKDYVFEYYRQRSGSAPKQILWVVTVPAIWDEPAKRAMRVAAARAGLVTEENSDDLVLAMEPECAILASIQEYRTPSTTAAEETAKPDLFTADKIIITVDGGGGTVDVTVNRVVPSESLQLNEVLPSGGGPWGATCVDRKFFEFMETKLLGEHWRSLQVSEQMDLITEWEVAKRSLPREAFEPSADKHCSMQVPTSGGVSLQTWRECVAAYNKRYFLEGTRASIQMSVSGKLQLPMSVVRDFFKDTFHAIATYLDARFAELSSRKYCADVMVLAGGFAECQPLQEYLHTRYMLTGKVKEIIVPKRPRSVVVSGSVLYALQPQPFTSRIMNYTYAFVAAERFSPVLHDASLRKGERAHILYPLVQKGEDVRPGHCVIHRNFTPSRPDQSKVIFKIYKINETIPHPKYDRVTPRAVPVEYEIPAGKIKNRCFPSSCIVCSVEVEVGLEGSEDRSVDLSLYFGRTEILVKATSSKSSHAVANVSVKFE